MLSISLNTVEYHVRGVLPKFGAKSRIEAVHKTPQQGLALPGAPELG